LNVKRCLAALAVCVACSFSIFPFAHGADPAVKRLRIVALDTVAQIAIVKLDDDRPQVWRSGESLTIGAQRARLHECVGNRVIVEITAQAGAIPRTVLIAVGDSYRLDIDRATPTTSSVSPVQAHGLNRAHDRH
jgi:hypothetical protein